MPPPPPPRRPSLEHLLTVGRLVGFALGAALGFLAVIAYDTSANVAVLEGHRRHASFSLALAVAGIVGIVGAHLGGRSD